MNQPAHTTVKTKHIINHEGLVFTLEGNHEQKFNIRSKMTFILRLENHGIMMNKNYGIKNGMAHLVKEVSKSKARTERHAYIKSLSVEELISHKDFAYSRFQNSTFGDYYNIYWRDSESPTGVSMVGGCDVAQWELISKKHGQSHNYLSPTEGRKTAY